MYDSRHLTSFSGARGSRRTIRSDGEEKTVEHAVVIDDMG